MHDGHAPGAPDARRADPGRPRGRPGLRERGLGGGAPAGAGGHEGHRGERQVGRDPQCRGH